MILVSPVTCETRAISREDFVHQKEEIDQELGDESSDISICQENSWIGLIATLAAENQSLNYNCSVEMLAITSKSFWLSERIRSDKLHKLMKYSLLLPLFVFCFGPSSQAENPIATLTYKDEKIPLTLKSVSEDRTD